MHKLGKFRGRVMGIRSIVIQPPLCFLALTVEADWCCGTACNKLRLVQSGTKSCCVFLLLCLCAALLCRNRFAHIVPWLSSSQTKLYSPLQSQLLYFFIYFSTATSIPNSQLRSVVAISPSPLSFIKKSFDIDISSFTITLHVCVMI